MVMKGGRLTIDGACCHWTLELDLLYSQSLNVVSLFTPRGKVQPPQIDERMGTEEKHICNVDFLEFRNFQAGPTVAVNGDDADDGDRREIRRMERVIVRVEGREEAGRESPGIRRA